MTLFRPSSKFSHSTQTQPTASMINFFKKRIRKFFVPYWMFFLKLALIWRIVDTFKIKLFISCWFLVKFWIFGHGTPKITEMFTIALVEPALPAFTWLGKQESEKVNHGTILIQVEPRETKILKRNVTF